MKKAGNILFSMTTAVILMTAFAVSIAWATFVERDYGTATAHKLVYNAVWFQIVLWLVAVNITGNMFKYKLVTRKKWTILLFHVAFLFILAGGAITSYFGYEGMIHIREGASSNQLQLKQTDLTLEADYMGVRKSVSKAISLTPRGTNQYSESLEIGGTKVRMETELYIPNAAEKLVPTTNGVPGISLFIMDSRKAGHESELLQGEEVTIDNQTYSFNSGQPGTITFSEEDKQPAFIANDTVLVTGMMTRDTTVLLPGIRHLAKEKTIYRVGGQVFVIKSFLPSAQKSMTSMAESNTGVQGLVVSLSTDNASTRVNLLNRDGEAVPAQTKLGDLNLTASFGSKSVELPFSIQLKDFILERYPGSNSPSSYASEVTVQNPDGSSFPYRIFMNHILKYKGYRFFQASYDRDERGTILSVSHDYWGTFFTYLGYLLMGLGMVLTLMNRNSRVHTLIRQGAQIRKTKRNTLGLITVFVLLTAAFPMSLNAQNTMGSKSQHLKELNSLLVQNRNGRIEPLSTMSSALMRKIHKSETYNGMSSTEVILGMLSHPAQWQQEKLIKVYNKDLASQLGSSGEYISFQQLFENGRYKLRELANKAYHTEPGKRNQFDKEVINLDERVNICYQLFNHSFLKLFPLPGNHGDSWATEQMLKRHGKSTNTAEPLSVYTNYLQAVQQAQTNGNWSQPDQLLLALKQYQLTNGGTIIPSQKKIRMEVFYNRANLFGKLAKTYSLFGLLLLILNLIFLFRPQMKLKRVNLVGMMISLLIFAVYTFALILRWYISGHAPWSNGYETMLFVGWATALAGLFLSRQSGITLAVTNLLAGIMLLVAGMSWLNPEITPLVPVLKSYWLIIHVAVITSSYGFLSIGALLGFLNLFLIIIRNSQNNQRLSLHIREITVVNEITLIVGLILLTAGSFLGGIWANESWGRYWGWDPKETWSLVTILVYAVVLHLRKIPGMKNNAIFNGLSVLSFGSVLMTFIGVNYYLSGLHSYAQGEAPPVPGSVYITVVVILAMMGAAYVKEKRSPVANLND
ncbi:cytochrome c biogenesis protein [Prolixibacter bellariivorans]|uniref:Cytochrome c biogenesis protein n=1 Tax=Prolixibacter bellariivorans TaxID=314319 RepID=A0A5M4B192_9BACT|nr:cytochrome c biogenesis protein CcsA [Prolixibacter bellariivorans]GET33932.1 cytochrome c biogenesis protein [Prolixibacter bellariivorans]